MWYNVLRKIDWAVLNKVSDGRSLMDGDDVRLNEFLKQQNDLGGHFTKAMNPEPKGGD